VAAAGLVLLALLRQRTMPVLVAQVPQVRSPEVLLLMLVVVGECLPLVLLVLVALEAVALEMLVLGLLVLRILAVAVALAGLALVAQAVPAS